MFKKTVLLLMIAVLCMGTVFTGCDKSGGDTDTSSESRTKRDLFELTIMDDMPDIFADFFDADRTHKPSEEALASVKEGMTYNEVVGIIGKPHDFGPLSGLFTLLWEADSGKEYRIYFTYEQEKNEYMTDAIIRTGVATSSAVDNIFFSNSTGDS